MSDTPFTRRDFVRHSLATAPALAAGGLPAITEPDAAPLRIVCVGAHPDDPESGCGGTLARYAASGHSVTIVYLTRGERGIDGTSLDDAARIRTAESEAACRILHAMPRFFGEIDGDTQVTRARADEMTRLLTAAEPDVLFAHWPVDTHMDHQVASLLTYRAWMRLPHARLYFFEVNLGSQTRGFHPDTYVDISAVTEQKKSALFAHVSQDGQNIWREHHELMGQWRGRECGVAAAEAFVHLSRDTQLSGLPGA